MIFWKKDKNKDAVSADIPASSPQIPVQMPDDDIAATVPQQTDHVDMQAESQQSGENWFSRLTGGLSKSTGRLGQGITDIFSKRKLDSESLQDLEDLLISADLGPKSAAKVIASFSKERFDRDIDPETVRRTLAGIIAETLQKTAQPLDIAKPEKGPFVLLVCGVNGAGKTTTIGKLAHKWHKRDGKNILIAAADTFRAAAVDQLDVWASRAGVPLFKKEIGADAASVAFEAYAKAVEQNADILIIDTAGRLQNKAHLMSELEKIVRVLKKHDASLPHACVLVLDSTTGQNAHSQVRIFKDAVNLTGLIVTKLDGSARGGVVVSLAEEFGLPVHAIGIGEGIDDLNAFSAQDYANALMGLRS